MSIYEQQERRVLVHHLLEKSTSRFPEKVALIHESTRATYGQLNRDSDRLAYFLLAEQDIQKGQRIIILMENGYAYAVAYYGILKSGAVAVPLSTDIKIDGFNLLLEEIEPSIIIASSRFERLLRASHLAIHSLRCLIIQTPKLNWSDSKQPCLTFEAITNSDAFTPSKKENTTSLSRRSDSLSRSDPASIIYTSGSTGKPKGVVLSHGNLTSNVSSICESLRLSENDIQMVVLPFFYVMGKSLLNTTIAVGGTLVINNKFAFPATVINQMIDEKVTLFSGVPSTYAYLLHRSPLKTCRDQLVHLRMVTQAGGHMASSLKKTLRDTLPGHTQICIMYGATEASARLTWLDPDYFEKKVDSIGKAIPNVTIQILDGSGNPVAKGEQGEIVAKGPNIMTEYWKDPEATGSVLDQNGYHTGDLGWQDSDGFIILSGRKDDILKVGGHRINPQEIEDALMASGLMIETAVIGISDTLLGHRLVALVVPLDETISQNAVMASCAALLPRYKLPSEILLVRGLPKNANGKIEKSGCLKMVMQASHATLGQ